LGLHFSSSPPWVGPDVGVDLSFEADAFDDDEDAFSAMCRVNMINPGLCVAAFMKASTTRFGRSPKSLQATLKLQ
jgi:hypothetical protein